MLVPSAPPSYLTGPNLQHLNPAASLETSRAVSTPRKSSFFTELRVSPVDAEQLSSPERPYGQASCSYASSPASTIPWGARSPCSPPPRAGQPFEANWADMPEHLLEYLMMAIKHNKSASADPKLQYAVCGVCRSWRNVAKRIFWDCPWQQHKTIKHPSQLFSLSPVPVDGGLVRCSVRRQLLSTGPLGRRYAYLAYLGDYPGHSSSMAPHLALYAEQTSRYCITIGATRDLASSSCAELRCNPFRTNYSLRPARAQWVRRALLAAGYDTSPSSPSSSPSTQWASAAASTACTPSPDANCYSSHSSCDSGGYSPRGPASPSPAPHWGLDSPSNESSGGGKTLQPQPQPPSPPPPAAAAAAPQQPFWSRLKNLAASVAGLAGVGAPSEARDGGPPCLLDVSYRVRMRGIMLPRRMSVSAAQPRVLRSNPLFADAPPCGSRGGSVSSTTTNMAAAMGAYLGEEVWEPRVSRLHSGPPALRPEEVQAMMALLQRQGQAGQEEGAAPQPSSPAATANAGSGGCSSNPLPALLSNVAPHWNPTLECWCLNFRGRVKLASVKNFQLTCRGDRHNRVVMQFGKVDEDVFVMDFNPCALNMLQAFALGLSSFETKIFVLPP